MGATCDECAGKFPLFQLYNADPWRNDRCPLCGVRLRAYSLRDVLVRADRAADTLVNALETIAAQDPAFTVDAESVMVRIQHILDGPRLVPAKNPGS